MTKEEAIDIIKSECYIFNPLNFDRSIMVNTALDMAVKALKQEPCEDAVSRQAVIDACDQSINIMEAVDRIIELPSVKPQPNVGHWKITHDDILQWWACSECGEPCLKGRYGGDFFSDFCPSCGARMVETEEMGFPAKVVREAITKALQGRK